MKLTPQDLKCSRVVHGCVPHYVSPLCYSLSCYLACYIGITIITQVHSGAYVISCVLPFWFLQRDGISSSKTFIIVPMDSLQSMRVIAYILPQYKDGYLPLFFQNVKNSLKFHKNKGERAIENERNCSQILYGHEGVEESVRNGYFLESSPRTCVFCPL